MAVAEKTKAKEKTVSLEDILAGVLRTGVYTSVIFMLLGLGLLVLKPAPVDAQVLSLGQMLSLALEFHPVGLLNLGLIVLLATPFVGVFITAITFIMKKESLFAIISLAVLIVLFISLAVGSA